jgi:hypothetical protein
MILWSSLILSAGGLGEAVAEGVQVGKGVVVGTRVGVDLGTVGAGVERSADWTGTTPAQAASIAPSASMVPRYNNVGMSFCWWLVVWSLQFTVYRFLVISAQFKKGTA